MARSTIGDGTIVVVGAALLELRFAVDGLPSSGGDVLAHGFEVRVGGSAVNVARTLQALGCLPLLVLHRGEGPFDRMVGRELAQIGLRLRGRRSRRPSGVTVTLVEPSGERSLVSALGAEGSVGAQDLPADVGKARAVYVSGYELLASPDLEAAIAALPRHVLVLFDPGPRGAWPGRLQGAWQRADVVRLNQEEAERRSGRKGAAEAAAAIGRTHDVVVSTADAAYVAVRGEVSRVAGGERVPRDTTGAGDAHAAGLLAGLTHGMDLLAATALANRVARLHVLGEDVGEAAAP